MRYYLKNKQNGIRFEFIVYDDSVTIVKIKKDKEPEIISPNTLEEARNRWNISVLVCDYERVLSV